MEQKKNNIDRYFRERLGDYGQDPPEASWEKIALQLQHKRKKGMAFILFRIAAGMALLVSTGLGIVLLTKPDHRPSTGMAVTSQHDATHLDTEPVQPAEPDIRENIAARPVSPSHPSLSRSKVMASSPSESAIVVSLTPVAAPSERATLTENSSREPVFPGIAGLHPRPLVQQKSSLTLYKPVVVNPIAEGEAYFAGLPSESEEFEPVKIERDRWALGSEIAPLYSYRTISTQNNQSDMNAAMNSSEDGLLAYAGGIRVAFSAGKRLSVQSGIYYSRYGQEKSKVETYDTDYFSDPFGNQFSRKLVSVVNSTGIIVNDNTTDAKYNVVVPMNSGTQSSPDKLYSLISEEQLYPNNSTTEEADISFAQYFDYFELPVLLKYKLVDRKIDFSFSGGVITNFLVSNTVMLIEDGKKSRFGETKNINQINYQGSFGLGIEYPVTSGFALTLEPRFRYYINPINQSSEISVHPFSFGFFAGFNYVF